VYRNVSYTIEVHLSQSVETSSGTTIMNRLRTELNADRVVNTDVDRLCVSFARNTDSLLREYENPSCVGRELVSLPSLVGDSSDATWQRAVLETSRVMLGVNGAPIPLSEPECDGSVIRWWLPSPLSPPQSHARVTVVTQYYEEVETRSFPVIFAHYYCLDDTHITFALEKHGWKTNLRAEEFFARGLGCPGGEVKRYTEGDRETVRYASPKGSLLWPGSGVLLHWDPERREVAESGAGARRAPSRARSATRPDAAAAERPPRRRAG
jgi:hypothetical protein